MAGWYQPAAEYHKMPFGDLQYVVLATTLVFLVIWGIHSRIIFQH